MTPTRLHGAAGSRCFGASFMLFGKLLPREGNFFALFNQHGDQIVAGSRAFMAMVENYADVAQRETHAGSVDQAEHQADKITAEVNRLLHKTFITPIDREQIHGLINAMDDVLDLLQDSAETMQLYDVRAMTEETRRLAELSVKCCERVAHAVSLLPKISDHADVRELIKLKAIYEQLESITDRCEDVANLIEGIVLENS